MRLWHKRLAPWFAGFLLLIAGTGLGIEATDLLDQRPPTALTAVRPALASCNPEKPQRTELGKWNHWLKQVHSGEVAGPLGAALNLATGAALLFFAGSGLWMYLQMGLRRRRARLR